MSASVADQTRILQGFSHKRHTRPAHPQHLSQALLSKRNIVALEQITASEQPAAQPCFERMSSVAGCRLLRLGQKELLMADQFSAKKLALLRKVADAVDIQSGSSACDLNDNSVQRDSVVKCRRATKQTVPSDHRGFDHLAVGEVDNHRDYTAEWEIHGFDRVASFEQHRIRGKIQNLPVWQQSRGFFRAKRCQKVIG